MGSRIYYSKSPEKLLHMLQNTSLVSLCLFVRWPDTGYAWPTQPLKYGFNRNIFNTEIGFFSTWKYGSLMRSSTHKRLNLWVGVSHYSITHHLCLCVFVSFGICVFIYLYLSLITLFIFLPLLIHRPLFAFLLPILWLGSFLQKSKEERWKSEIWDTVFWRGTEGIPVFSLLCEIYRW